MTKQKPAVSFIVPGNNRSGGIRVTVYMANCLLNRGYRVRILHPGLRPFTSPWIKAKLDVITGKAKNAGWLHEFRGRVEPFRTINQVSYADKEIVIAVGTMTIAHLEALQAKVVKLKYNHGLLTNMSAEDIRLWSLPLPTITVSSTLKPDLEKMSGQPVVAVVPNGIDIAEYHPLEGVPRDALGTIYSSHPAKAPEFLLNVLQQVRERWPNLPLVVFGTEPKPPELGDAEYHRLPSVAEACKIYSRAKIWLLASQTEGFPGPLLESMACRCVAISTDTYGGREIIQDGENGLLVPRGDMAACLKQIERVLSDEDLAKRLADNGHQTALAYSWDAAADKMEAALETVSKL